MSEVPSPRLRISDQDRESALTALGEHMTVGRIDIDEFGERSARITAAKTRGELAEIFLDLPEPHPRYDAPKVAVEKPVSPWAGISPTQRVMGALLPILFIATIALIITTGITWWFILVPIGISAVGEGIWGKGWENSHKKLGKQRRRELDG
ncbi:DUF1707 domain-containing protein [Amycolatopsis sp. EV170708-02-1]|uniref:DUF1707 SHOCT-like domain-containing protein n=1 Tax=Amycolatopsis sp. EV170708-02-1 TaxID=2919322 RepID=UPI001F0C87A8|nr:DUF1707 domain-containing protein [Amycolatopsis sp. EV170708-02-1]UMP01936.1 DUF1707 domain-containing protein [Amycolatopsis sp. EV170708-02-1]